MTPEQKTELWQIYRSFGADAATMNHWDLQEASDTDADTWKAFLNETDVVDWVNSELNIVQKTELSKMVKGVNASRSVGQAQLISALSKMQGTHDNREGPIFIYTYIPLNTEQQQAENVRLLTCDPFLKEQEDEHEPA